MVLPHYGVRRRAPRGHGSPDPLARESSDDAAELDRQVRGCPGDICPRAGSRDRDSGSVGSSSVSGSSPSPEPRVPIPSRSSRLVSTRSSVPPSCCSARSIRSSRVSPNAPPIRPASSGRRMSSGCRTGPRASAATSRNRVSTQASRDQSIHRAARPDLGRQLRPWRIRHRCGDGRAGSRSNAISSSRGSSTCRCVSW